MSYSFKQISISEINNTNSVINNDSKTKATKSQSIIYRCNTFIEQKSFVSWIIFIFALALISIAFWTSSISNKMILSTFWSATCNSLNKILLITGLGLIIHLTFLNHFAAIRKLLSLKIISIISRSTYGIYIVHAYYPPMFGLAYDTYYYVKISDLFILVIGVFIISWLTAFVFRIDHRKPLNSI